VQWLDAHVEADQHQDARTDGHRADDHEEVVNLLLQTGHLGLGGRRHFGDFPYDRPVARVNYDARGRSCIAYYCDHVQTSQRSAGKALEFFTIDTQNSTNFMKVKADAAKFDKK